MYVLCFTSSSLNETCDSRMTLNAPLMTESDQIKTRTFSHQEAVHELWLGAKYT